MAGGVTDCLGSVTVTDQLSICHCSRVGRAIFLVVQSGGSRHFSSCLILMPVYVSILDVLSMHQKLEVWFRETTVRSPPIVLIGG